MDGATTAVIVLIFIVSIFSGFGTNRGYTPPSPPPVFPIPTTGTVQFEPAPGEPDPRFAAGGGETALPAIQNYIQKYRKNEEAAAISSSIVHHAQTYDMNPRLVAALIARESKFNPRALSSSGAAGLGQLLPSTAKNLGVEDAFDIDQNAMGTVRYLKSLIDRFKGNVSNAIAGYLEGPNAILRNGGYSSQSAAYVSDILKIYQKI